MPKVSFRGCAFCSSEKLTFHNGAVKCGQGHVFHTCDVHDDTIISGPRTTPNGTCSCHTANNHMFILQNVPKMGTCGTYLPAEIAHHNSLFARWEMTNKYRDQLREEIHALIHRHRLAEELERLVTCDPDDAKYWFAILGYEVRRVQNGVKDLGFMIEDREIALGKVHTECNLLAAEANALRTEIQNKYHAQVKEIPV